MCKISLNKSSFVAKVFYDSFILLIFFFQISIDTILLKAVLHRYFHFSAFEIQVHFRRNYLFLAYTILMSFLCIFKGNQTFLCHLCQLLFIFFSCNFKTINYISHLYKWLKKTLFWQFLISYTKNRGFFKLMILIWPNKLFYTLIEIYRKAMPLFRSLDLSECVYVQIHQWFA